MEAWADLAQFFHWPPSELERLDWTDLLRWHRIAETRLRAMLDAAET